MRTRQTPLSGTKWLPVRNTDDTQSVPPFAVMKVVGMDPDGTYQIAQPDGDNQTNILLCGPVGMGPAVAIQYPGPNGELYDPGSYGQGHLTLPGLVWFDTSDTPEVNEQWGTIAGDWRIHKNRAGFRIAGDSPLGENGDVISADVDMAAVETTIVRKASDQVNRQGLYPGFVQLWKGSRLPGNPWEDGPPCLIDDANR